MDKIHYPIRFSDVLSALVVRAEMDLIRDLRCADALDLLAGKHLAHGSFPVEWTNLKKATLFQTCGTHAGRGPLSKAKGHPLVTVDAIRVLRESGRLSGVSPAVAPAMDGARSNRRLR